jgi:hypothetical protein
MRLGRYLVSRTEEVACGCKRKEWWAFKNFFLGGGAVIYFTKIYVWQAFSQSKIQLCDQDSFFLLYEYAVINVSKLEGRLAHRFGGTDS